MLINPRNFVIPGSLLHKQDRFEKLNQKVMQILPFLYTTAPTIICSGSSTCIPRNSRRYFAIARSFKIPAHGELIMSWIRLSFRTARTVRVQIVNGKSLLSVWLLENPQNRKSPRLLPAGSLLAPHPAWNPQFQISRIESALWHGIQIAFRNKLRIGILDGNDADTQIFRERPFRRQLLSRADISQQYVIFDTFI